MKFNASRLLSLKVILTIPLVLQLLVVVVGISWLADRSARQVVNHLTLLLMENIGDRLNVEIQNLLAKPVALTQGHQNLIDLGLLNLKDLEPWGPYIYTEYLDNRDSSISGYFICRQDNEVRSAGHTYNTQGEKIQGLGKASQINNYQYYAYFSIEDYQQRQGATRLLDRFECTKRPWYTTTIANNKPQWIPVFRRQIDQKRLAINYSRPLYSPDRSQRLGVTSIQLDLDYLNRFLQSLIVGQTGSVYIIDDQGYLIADSTGQSLFKIVDQKAVPIQISESTNPILKQISRDLISLGSISISRQYYPNFLLDSERYFVLVIPLPRQNELQWSAIIAIPQRDILREIWQTQRLTVFFSILALMIAIISGTILAHYITQPITRLSQATLAFAQGDWQQTFIISQVRELKNFAQAFHQMAGQVQYSVQKLQDQEQQLRQFLEAIPLGVAVYDIQQELTFINKPGKHFLGEINQNLDSIGDSLCLTFEGQSGYLDNIKIKGNQGEIIIEIWTTPIYGQGDKVIYALVLLQDVTTRKQAEQLLRDYNQALAAAVKQKTQEIMMAQQQAERANQAKSLLLRNMSHELKTPLHVIIGFTNLMLQDLDYSENDALPLSKIRQNARHLLLVINNLLDLSKIQQGKLNTDSQWIELVDFVTEIQENFQLNAQAKNLAFTVHFLTPCPPLVQVDVIKLRQILFNLLSNAFKFTLVGKVSIRVACDQLTADKARLDFWIEDTGVGISQLAQKHLFRDFYRGDVLDVITEGTGLGLALTKQYVHLLGGKIDLISEQEKGTCVHFFVPVPITATAVNWVHHADEVVGQPDGDGFPISRLPSLLTTLAPQWHQAFYESLRKLDEARMLALLAEIRPSHPELSRYLEGLVKNLEFQLLLDLFLALISPGDRQ